MKVVYTHFAGVAVKDQYPSLPLVFTPRLTRRVRASVVRVCRTRTRRRSQRHDGRRGLLRSGRVPSHYHLVSPNPLRYCDWGTCIPVDVGSLITPILSDAVSRAFVSARCAWCAPVGSATATFAVAATLLIVVLVRAQWVCLQVRQAVHTGRSEMISSRLRSMFAGSCDVGGIDGMSVWERARYADW